MAFPRSAGSFRAGPRIGFGNSGAEIMLKSGMYWRLVGPLILASQRAFTRVLSITKALMALGRVLDRIFLSSNISLFRRWSFRNMFGLQHWTMAYLRAYDIGRSVRAPARPGQLQQYRANADNGTGSVISEAGIWHGLSRSS